LHAGAATVPGVESQRMRLVFTLVMAATIATATQAAQTRRLAVPELSQRFSHSPLDRCPGRAETTASRVRIASWNIKAARAASLDVLAAEMRAMDADVIALQEVDVHTRRGGDVDQPGTLAASLGFHYVFAASIRWSEGDYGLALVSKWPLVDVERRRVGVTDAGEPRIVLDATVCVAGRPLRILNHHADDLPATRARSFADVRQIVAAAIGHGLLLVGDFNESADGPGIRMLRDTGLVDLGAEGGVSTSDWGRIDYVFADPLLARYASTVRVWRTDNSDHHAVLIELDW
jgi:endonuclease/exonuclease/phosphatase family metal-dependent hydrolase